MKSSSTLFPQAKTFKLGGCRFALLACRIDLLQSFQNVDRFMRLLLCCCSNGTTSLTTTPLYLKSKFLNTYKRVQNVWVSKDCKRDTEETQHSYNLNSQLKLSTVWLTGTKTSIPKLTTWWTSSRFSYHLQSNDFG